MSGHDRDWCLQVLREVEEFVGAFPGRRVRVECQDVGGGGKTLRTIDEKSVADDLRQVIEFLAGQSSSEDVARALTSAPASAALQGGAAGVALEP